MGYCPVFLVRMTIMEHYDGPAFFRRRLTEQKKLHSKDRLTTEGIRSTGSRSREFHPSYIPPSVLALGSNNLKIRYQKLVTEIAKSDDDYLLFDDPCNSDQAIDLLHFTSSAEKLDEKKQNPNEKPDLAKRQGELNSGNSVCNKEDSQAKKSNLNFNRTVRKDADIKQKKQQSQDYHKVVTNEKQQRENHLGHDQRSTIREDHKGEVRSSVQVANQSSVSHFKVGPAKPLNENGLGNTKGTDDHKTLGKALNKSLGDILSEENNAQRDLKIFDISYNNPHELPQNSDHGYQFPPLKLLPKPVEEDSEQSEEWALGQAEILNETFKAFNVNAQVKDWTVGPTVTQFEITLDLGVKVSKITNLTDDLKLALAAKDIRIEAPIAGKSSVGIEIPNQNSRPVMLSEVLNSPQFQKARSPLTVALGVDLFGVPQITNIHDMPHGLIAGATGSGKSVFINSLLVSLLYKATPAQVKLLLIDPKTVELAPYSDLPHLIAPVVSDPQAATASLKWAVEEMNNRYEKLAAAGVRDIDSFNQKADETGDYGIHMPYIVIIIDELADLMMTASSEIADYIGQITAKARACGIHLLVATQRPSVDVITGTMKNNIPTRIAFMVSSQVDSRTIIDSAGAEKLLGRGDMLYLGNGKSQPVRLQGTYINDDEIDQVVSFVKQQGKPHYEFDPDNLKRKELNHEKEDELLPQILEYIVNEESISTSKLQRVFSIGYNRAARIIEQLEKKQYISPAHGSKPRKVFLTEEELDKMMDE